MQKPVEGLLAHSLQRFNKEGGGLKTRATEVTMVQSLKGTGRNSTHSKEKHTCQTTLYAKATSCCSACHREKRTWSRWKLEKPSTPTKATSNSTTSSAKTTAT